jgi:hypothetical protein
VDDEIEYQLPQLFAQVAGHIEPPVEEILAASIARGRRSRRRRTAVSACAAFGVLGLTAGAVIGVQRIGIGTAAHGRGPALAGGAAHRSGTASSPTGSARPPTTDQPDAAAASARAHASALSVSSAPVTVLSTGPQSGTALLTRLLSGYGLHSAGDAPNGAVGVADLVYDDGHGRSEIIAWVQRYTSELARDHAFTCVNFIAADSGARPSGAPEPSCTQARTADGLSEYLVVTSDDAAGFYDYQVNLFTSDGLVVALDAGNGVPDGANVAVTRAAPPLSLAAMQAVVADPGWLAYRDGA